MKAVFIDAEARTVEHIKNAMEHILKETNE